ncbi:BrnA antitoxin family protein [Allorhizobium undicola]|uniref:BrnA antitoxin family protein n=1 Tax=Allorhizobium undicola TaxID=78527 RepID=UPI0004811D91|nr:BrnA antitoxin family protein [Allorhizobium undicola]
MNKKHIVKYSAEDIQEKIGQGEDFTDWQRVNALSDADIERAMRDDPDWQEFIDIDWSKAEMVYPKKKKAISIRLDDDIVDYFQSSGKGYQTRINAVLRHFLNEQKRLTK